MRFGLASVIAVLVCLTAACSPAPPPAPTAVATTTVLRLVEPTASQTATAAAPATATPTREILPTATLPAPTPTDAPRAWQLTTGGCCPGPAWAPDSQQVWHIDRQGPQGPGGLMAIDAAPGSEARFLTDKLGIYSADRSLRAFPQSGQTRIENSDGQQWVAPSAGRPVAFSPDSTMIAWQVAGQVTAFGQRMAAIWVARVDGSEARIVADLPGGSLAAWFADGQRLLVTLRTADAGDGRESVVLASLDVNDGRQIEITGSASLRGASLSPDGGWVAFQITFSGDAAQDGLWIAATDGSQRRRLDIYGAYRWRAEGRLIVIPLDLDARGQRLIEVNAESGAARPITDPDVTPLRIAGGDWALSPNGQRLAFVAVEDRNIWVLELTD